MDMHHHQRQGGGKKMIGKAPINCLVTQLPFSLGRELSTCTLLSVTWMSETALLVPHTYLKRGLLSAPTSHAS